MLQLLNYSFSVHDYLHKDALRQIMCKNGHHSADQIKIVNVFSWNMNTLGTIKNSSFAVWAYAGWTRATVWSRLKSLSQLHTSFQLCTALIGNQRPRSSYPNARNFCFCIYSLFKTVDNKIYYSCKYSFLFQFNYFYSPYFNIRPAHLKFRQNEK